MCKSHNYPFGQWFPWFPFALRYADADRSPASRTSKGRPGGALKNALESYLYVAYIVSGEIHKIGFTCDIGFICKIRRKILTEERQCLAKQQILTRWCFQKLLLSTLPSAKLSKPIPTT